MLSSFQHLFRMTHSMDSRFQALLHGSIKAAVCHSRLRGNDIENSSHATTPRFHGNDINNNLKNVL
ncbi:MULTISPECIES: hypothetical protein [unclassified Rickettsia]|uniref:hypothetical protein n=1 Tax=unclassified Rickettsia TaxID=114295 RepID=UPI003132A60A